MTSPQRTEPGADGMVLITLRAVPDDGLTARPASTAPAPPAREDSYGHLAPRLAEFAATAPDDPRHRALRDELASAFWPVVANIARRYRDRGEPLADLEQVGAVGLLGALQRFDPGRGSDFLSFAVPTITGEIRRHFRDSAWTMRVPDGSRTCRARSETPSTH